ncbi:MAG: hypothetical protein K2L03_06420 [Bacteroidales bacterium]|nr:hypothetical protein [Bacteroidales bacterium]
MKKQNLLTIWAKRAIPALALAAMVLPACEKPVEQHDEVILYYYNNNNNPKWNMETLNKYAADKTVRNVYITVAPGEKFTSLTSDDISFTRRELQNAMNVSQKNKGTGNFLFTPGRCLYGDSLDFVAMGFTVNQQNQ